MSTLFAPFRDLDPLARPRLVPSAAPGVPFDAVRDDDGVVVSFDLPGVDPATVDLSVDGNVLTLSAERSAPVPDGATALVRERRHGALQRRLRLSDSLDLAAIEATLDNGVLTVRIPVSASAQPHKVEIQVGASALGGAPTAVEASAQESAAN